MRKMHEFKINDVIMNELILSNHEVDLRFDFETDRWKFSPSSSNKKFSEFSNGEIVLIETESTQETASRYCLGFILKTEEDFYARPLGDLSLMNEDASMQLCAFINYTFADSSVYIYDFNDADIVCMHGDAINIYKL